MGIPRARWLVTTLLGALVFAQPSVVLVIADNQDAASIAYMPVVGSSPAARFSNAFVSYPLCCPSRASVLSGQHPQNHGVLENSPPNGGYQSFDHANSLPVWLQSAGYYTGYIGKYLNGYGQAACRQVPLGFDEWFGTVTQGRLYDFVLNENSVLTGYGNPTSYPAGCAPAQIQTDQYETDLFHTKAVDFIARNASRRFFLVVAFGAVESRGRDGLPGPEPAPRHKGMFAGISIPPKISFNEADVTDKPAFIRSLPLLTNVQKLNVTYRRTLESLQSVDEAVAAMTRALPAGSILIYTSDQGSLLGEHRIVGLGSVYEESIRVPLVVMGAVAPLSHAELTSNVDFAPKILELAKATAGKVMDGMSLAPLLNGQAIAWRTALLIQAQMRKGFTAAGNYIAVRTGSHVYAEHTNGAREFYDLVADPYQAVNKSRSHAPQDLLLMQQLRSKLNALKTCAGTGCWQ